MDATRFITRWTASGERANKAGFLGDLCDVLGVPRPDPKCGDRARDRYCYAADAVMTRAAGAPTIGKMDLYKADAFVLAARQAGDAGSAVLGTAPRGTPKWAIAMNDAKGQALTYALTLDAPPPFLLVVDVGHCIDVYAAFGGSTDYRPFPDARTHRLYLPALAEHLPLLRAIWTDPHSLDPARRKAEVTREIAGHVADLAASLQKAGHAPETVARFLMRCLFTMFAEDVELLPHVVFTDALRDRWIAAPETFAGEVSALWQTMNTGGTMSGVGRVLRFDGGLFRDASALSLTSEQLRVLLAAARCGWADVEPAIFGTLLERALDERERHRLGAHYTPRAYVERLVGPTIEAPLRAEWDLARVEARQLVTVGEVEEAREVVGAFHNTLCNLRVLDPACGTGNFLYVALDTFKRLESEVLAMLADLGDTQAFGRRVVPSQFLGIEKKPWAKEIAELVLWMGYLSWNVRISGEGVRPKEPVLENYGHIEGRDAVLSWDEEAVDDTARVPVVRYVRPRAATWPDADFVVGNPPYIGAGRMREALGEGYVEALRAAHDVPESADLVMYWWDMAAHLARAGRIRRFGFITTKAITQTFNRRVVEAHLGAKAPLSIVYAVPNHPWPDGVEDAAVRVAMTVGMAGEHDGLLATVVDETGDEVTVSTRWGKLHANLQIGANVGSAQPLRANAWVASPGVKLHGAGFIVTQEEAVALGLGRVPGLDAVIVPYRNGRDLAARSRDVRVIDLHGRGIDAVRDAFPEVYRWVKARVKPERDQNNEAYRRDNWWLFGRTNTELRGALAGLPRYIATVETSKFRWFTFLDATIRPDNMLIAFGVDDAALLAVLSSRIHVVWALAAGGRLGVGNDPRYNKSTCFDAFPFPTLTDTQRAHLAALGERLDAHRKARQALHPDLTLTGMYNVLASLRAGTPLTDKERVVDDQGLVSILRELHGEVDVAVAAAYGWPETLPDEDLLVRLVALNTERVEAERRGVVYWVRPDYQRPLAGETPRSAGGGATGPHPGENDPSDAGPSETPKVKWPATLSDRIAAVRAQVLRAPGAVGLEDVASVFGKVSRKDVGAILESLAALGIVARFGTPAGPRWQATGRAVG